MIITILDDPDDSHQVQARIEEANRRLAGLVQPAQSPSSWQNRRPAQHEGRVSAWGGQVSE